MEVNTKKIKPGQLVKIKDSFLRKYFPETNGNYINHGKGRPFFFVFSEQEDLIWVVPLTSDKSGKIRENIKKYKLHENLKYPSWNEVANVFGKERVFKLSGMFPVPKSEVEIFENRLNPNMPPMSPSASKFMLNKCIKYYNQHFDNITQGLKPLIVSPYKEILRDYYKAKDLEKSNVKPKPIDPEHEDPEVSDDDSGPDL